MTVVLEKIQPYSKERYEQELVLALLKGGFIDTFKQYSRIERSDQLMSEVHSIMKQQGYA